MSIALKIILITQMLSAITMIGLILVQHGKGADMGAAFGSGGSGSLFGASGSANFLSRATSALAVVFFVCTMALSYFGNIRPTSSGSVLDNATITTPAPAAPAVPASPASQIPDNKTVAPPTSTSTPASSAPATPSSAPASTPSAIPAAPVDASKPVTQIPTK